MFAFLKQHKILSTLVILMLIAVIFFVSVILIHIYWYRSNKCDVDGFISEITPLDNGEVRIKLVNDILTPESYVCEINVSDENLIVGRYSDIAVYHDKQFSVEDLKEGNWLGVKYKMFSNSEILWIKVIPIDLENSNINDVGKTSHIDS